MDAKLCPGDCCINLSLSRPQKLTVMILTVMIFVRTLHVLCVHKLAVLGSW